MLKLLFHRETLQILGIHCFGSNASEIIHIGQAIMSQSGTANSLLYFINTTFNYPDDGRSLPRGGAEWLQPLVLVLSYPFIANQLFLRQTAENACIVKDG